MRSKHLAILIGLGISAFTAFYLLTLLLLTEFIVFPNPEAISAPISLSAARSLVQMPESKPQVTAIPLPTISPTEGLYVTDPRMVILGADDVPRDLKVNVELTRYVDNARLIRNSPTPLQTQRSLLESGRLNAVQTAFKSDDPIASQLRSTGILNFAEIYETSDQAQRAWQDPPELLAARFPADGQILLENELTILASIGDAFRSFEGSLSINQQKMPLYAIVLCRKNTLVGIIILGGERDKLIRDGQEYADLLD